jgi:outer membrane immunogenic protein
MKSLTRSIVVFCACNALALTAFAGPEPSGKEMKQVAPPPPPCCNWTGFYVGAQVGGEFGHSEITDHDFNFVDKTFGFSESGVIGGGEIGYNFQWNWLVLGPEIDGGYMNLDGHHTEPGIFDTRAETSSDWYATFRGRVGVALDCWLIYATGGGIAVNYETRVTDNCFGGNCGDQFVAEKQDVQWGYTVGGGVERCLGPHWSIKAEYLYFKLDSQSFSGHEFDDPADRFHFSGETFGHIVRAGLNYRF